MIQRYSLGAKLYELLLKHPTFDADSIDDMFYGIDGIKFSGYFDFKGVDVFLDVTFSVGDFPQYTLTNDEYPHITSEHEGMTDKQLLNLYMRQLRRNNPILDIEVFEQGDYTDLLDIRRLCMRADLLSKFPIQVEAKQMDRDCVIISPYNLSFTMSGKGQFRNRKGVDDIVLVGLEKYGSVF